MSIQKAGTVVTYAITFLEMVSRPDFDWPRLPLGSTAALLKSEEPPVWWFLALYDAVGRDYAWEDVHTWEHAEIESWLRQDKLALFTLLDHGWPQGFFVLNDASEGVVNLEYFGMVPEALGRRLGGWLLKTAILTAWDLPDTTEVTVNTCTLDHPRALALYQKYGFMPVRREERTRVLTRDRDLSQIPS